MFAKKLYVELSTRQVSAQFDMVELSPILYSVRVWKSSCQNFQNLKTRSSFKAPRKKKASEQRKRWHVHWYFSEDLNFLEQNGSAILQTEFHRLIAGNKRNRR